MADKLFSDLAKGAYNGATAYTVGDFVTYNGSSYACVQNSTGNLPTDTDYWALLASKGDTGNTGPQGNAGSNGTNGTNGSNGTDGEDAFVYVAYASADDGTGFTMTFDAALNYIAILSTDTEIASPQASDFAGLWKNYKGQTGSTGGTGPQGDPGVVQSIVAGTNVSVDDTDPANPIINASGDVASVNGQTGVVNLDADDIDDTSTTNKFTTSAEISKLAGIETAADVTDAGNVGSSIHGATGKATPVDADTMPLIDSAASNVLKKVTWLNIKATLKTYFDTLYLALSGGALTGALNEAKGTDIASATTTDIGAATGNYAVVTGTTTITGLGTVQAGTRRIVKFAGILTLTHHATSLILPTGANITTAADDVATFVSLGSGNWVCVGYQRKDGTALASAGGGGGGYAVVAYQTATAAASITVSGLDLSAAGGNYVIDVIFKGTTAAFISFEVNGASSGNHHVYAGSYDYYNGTAITNNTAGNSVAGNAIDLAGFATAMKGMNAKIDAVLHLYDGTNIRPTFKIDAMGTGNATSDNSFEHWKGAAFLKNQTNLTSLKFQANTGTGNWEVRVLKALNS